MRSSLSEFGVFFFHPRSLAAFSSLLASAEQLKKQVVYSATSKGRVAAKVQDLVPWEPLTRTTTADLQLCIL